MCVCFPLRPRMSTCDCISSGRHGLYDDLLPAMHINRALQDFIGWMGVQDQ